VTFLILIGAAVVFTSRTEPETLAPYATTPKSITGGSARIAETTGRNLSSGVALAETGAVTDALGAPPATKVTIMLAVANQATDNAASLHRIRAWRMSQAHRCNSAKSLFGFNRSWVP